MARDRFVNNGGQVQYISTITNVREVALTGTADLTYWRERLQSDGLSPFNDNGRASLLITAIESKFRAIPFRELSISVVVSHDSGATAGGAYLVYAFNSSRLLALAERTFFQTPYQPADLIVDERVPARMAIAAAGEFYFNAQMGLNPPSAGRDDAIFEGPIYLPGGKKVFYARLSGADDRYSFSTSDEIAIRSHPQWDVLTQLMESDFAGKEWLVRSGAVHARSRSFQRKVEWLPT